MERFGADNSSPHAIKWKIVLNS